MYCRKNEECPLIVTQFGPSALASLAATIPSSDASIVLAKPTDECVVFVNSKEHSIENFQLNSHRYSSPLVQSQPCPMSSLFSRGQLSNAEWFSNGIGSRKRKRTNSHGSNDRDRPRQTHCGALTRLRVRDNDSMLDMYDQVIVYSIAERFFYSDKRSGGLG